jgi:hypothetical protein
MTQAPQQRQDSWAWKAVALFLGSRIVTPFSYSLQAFNTSAGDHHSPLAFLVKVQEWHFRQEKLHPD